MNIKNRLMKLEQLIRPVQMPLVMIKFNDIWTSDQLQQMKEAEVQGRKILRVVFVGGKQNVDA